MVTIGISTCHSINIQSKPAPKDYTYLLYFADYKLALKEFTLVILTVPVCTVYMYVTFENRQLSSTPMSHFWYSCQYKLLHIHQHTTRQSTDIVRYYNYAPLTVLHAVFSLLNYMFVCERPHAGVWGNPPASSLCLRQLLLAVPCLQWHWSYGGCGKWSNSCFVQSHDKLLLTGNCEKLQEPQCPARCAGVGHGLAHHLLQGSWSRQEGPGMATVGLAI